MSKSHTLRVKKIQNIYFEPHTLEKCGYFDIIKTGSWTFFLLLLMSHINKIPSVFLVLEFWTYIGEGWIYCLFLHFTWRKDVMRQWKTTTVKIYIPPRASSIKFIDTSIKMWGLILNLQTKISKVYDPSSLWILVRVRKLVQIRSESGNS